MINNNNKSLNIGSHLNKGVTTLNNPLINRRIYLYSNGFKTLRDCLLYGLSLGNIPFNIIFNSNDGYHIRVFKIDTINKEVFW